MSVPQSAEAPTVSGEWLSGGVKMEFSAEMRLLNVAHLDDQTTIPFPPFNFAGFRWHLSVRLHRDKYLLVDFRCDRDGDDNGGGGGGDSSGGRNGNGSDIGSGEGSGVGSGVAKMKNRFSGGGDSSRARINSLDRCGGQQPIEFTYHLTLVGQRNGIGGQRRRNVDVTRKHRVVTDHNNTTSCLIPEKVFRFVLNGFLDENKAALVRVRIVANDVDPFDNDREEGSVNEIGAHLGHNQNSNEAQSPGHSTSSQSGNESPNYCSETAKHGGNNDPFDPGNSSQSSESIKNEPDDAVGSDQEEAVTTNNGEYLGQSSSNDSERNDFETRENEENHNSCRLENGSQNGDSIKNEPDTTTDEFDVDQVETTITGEYLSQSGCNDDSQRNVPATATNGISNNACGIESSSQNNDSMNEPDTSTNDRFDIRSHKSNSSDGSRSQKHFPVKNGPTEYREHRRSFDGESMADMVAHLSGQGNQKEGEPRATKRRRVQSSEHSDLEDVSSDESWSGSDAGMPGSDDEDYDDREGKSFQDNVGGGERNRRRGGRKEARRSGNETEMHDSDDEDYTDRKRKKAKTGDNKDTGGVSKFGIDQDEDDNGACGDCDAERKNGGEKNVYGFGSKNGGRGCKRRRECIKDGDVVLKNDDGGNKNSSVGYINGGGSSKNDDCCEPTSKHRPILVSRRAESSDTASQTDLPSLDSMFHSGDRLLNEFRCANCRSLLAPPIVACRRFAHFFCAACNRLRQNCSSCGAPLVADYRSRTLEKLTAFLLYPCPNGDCNARLKQSERETHTGECPHRVTRCLVPHCNACPVKVPQFRAHLRTVHPHIVRSVQLNQAVKLNLLSPTSYFDIDDQILGVSGYFLDSCLYVWVRLFGSPAVAQQYSFEIRMTRKTPAEDAGNRDKMEMSWKSVVPGDTEERQTAGVRLITVDLMKELGFVGDGVRLGEQHAADRPQGARLVLYLTVFKEMVVQEIEQ